MQPGRLSSLVGALAATTLLASSLAAQNPRLPGGRVVVPPGAAARPVTPDPLSPAPCCHITALSGSMVTALDSASGNTFQFRVNDRAVLRTLVVGGPVWADPAAGRAGVRSGVLCCAIVGAGRPAAAVAAPVPAPQAPAAAVVSPSVRSAEPAVAAIAPVTTRPLVAPTDLMGTVTVESPVHGGWEAKMTVTLAKPAPATNPGLHCRGLFISTESSHPVIAPVPVSLCIQTGQTTETFEIRTTGVATNTPVTISARYLEFPARTATLDVLAPAIARIELADTSATGGDTLSAVLHFTGPPPASPPIKGYLQSTDPAVATVPATVTLPPNATTVPFKVLIHPVAEDTELRIRASRNPFPSAPPQGGGGVGLKGALGAAQQVAVIATDIQAVEIAVLPAELKSTYISDQITSPSKVGASLEGLAPPGGAVVQLSSQRPDLLGVPASITIPEGSTSASAVVEMGTPSGDQASVRVTGIYRGVTRSDDFTIQKHDFKMLPAIVFTDRYGNPVTTPQDGQPLTMCARIHLCGGDLQNSDCGNTPLPPTVVLNYDYRAYHPTTQTSSGRSGNLTLGIDQQIPACMGVGGVDAGGWLEIDLVIDPANLIPERSESNNEKSIRITRP
ncbi:MAG: hypothetical protein ABR559_01510 [Gemmatimonadota bacterium]